MSDMRSRSSCRKGCSSGVGKQVQDFDRTSGITDLFREPVPVCRLFGKEACMLETEWFQIKSKRAVMNLPLFRKTEELPFTAAFSAAVIMTVHVLPSSVVSGRVPDDLGIRPHKDIITPALQLLSF